MTMTLLEGEPAAGPWRAVDALAIVEHVLQVAGRPLDRPVIVAVDGRGRQVSRRWPLSSRVLSPAPPSSMRTTWRGTNPFSAGGTS